MIYERPAVHYLGITGEFLTLFSMKRILAPVDNDWRVEKLRSFIDTGAAKARGNLDQACRKLQLGVSSRQARRLFRACTGLGIKEYRMKRRLAAAAHKLRTTNLRIGVIAKQVGYRHVSTFSRCFLKQFHMPPTHFRSLRPGKR